MLQRTLDTHHLDTNAVGEFFSFLFFSTLFHSFFPFSFFLSFSPSPDGRMPNRYACVIPVPETASKQANRQASCSQPEGKNSRSPSACRASSRSSRRPAPRIYGSPQRPAKHRSTHSTLAGKAADTNSELSSHPQLIRLQLWRRRSIIAMTTRCAQCEDSLPLAVASAGRALLCALRRAVCSHPSPITRRS